MKRKTKADRTRDNKTIIFPGKDYALVVASMRQSRKYAKELQDQIGEKTTPKHLCDLTEEYIFKAALLIKPFGQLPKKKYEELYLRIFIAFNRLIKSLIDTSQSNGGLDYLCLNIAHDVTNYLTNYVYKNPTPDFCKSVRPHLTLPFLISPWDSATEIKNTFDRASERVGLAKIYNIKSKCRYASIPTRIVLMYYTKQFLFTSRPPVAQANLTDYWQAVKNDLTKYFDKKLLKEYPEYYRTLRDDNGDKTPVYIKRKLWLQACKQALKVIAKANTPAAV